MLTEALRYAERGWFVFPVIPRDKVPLTVHGFKDASRRPDDIRAWWTATPDANVAIATGESNLAVLDVDAKNGGLERLYQLEKDNRVTRTLRAFTGGGGRHLIYSQHAGRRIRNSAGKLGPGLDTRGDGGYIVVPPSLHPSGSLYAWENNHTVVPFPAPLLALLEDRRSTLPLEDPVLTAAAPGGKVAEGGRNAHLTSLAGTMRKRGMGAASILAALLVENSSTCSPPLPAREVETIARSVGRYQQGDIFPNVSSVVGDVGDWTVRASHVKPEKVPFLYAPYLPAARLTLLSGNPGEGKTWFSLALAAAGSVGGRLPFAGPIAPFTTLYCSTEDSIADTLVPRLISLGADLDRIHLLTPDYHIPLDERAKWYALIQKLDARLVVIDTIQAFMPKGADINNMLSCRWTLRLFTDVMRETGAAGLLIRHFRKSQEGGNKMHYGAGSIDLTALVRSEMALTLDAADSGLRYVEQIKSSAAKHGPTIAFSVEDGAVIWRNGDNI